MARKLIIGENDFETWCKNNDISLLDEWDSSNEVRPSEIQYGSSRKVWWIGKCGHRYQASLNKRTSDRTSCPYCANYHAKLLKGFNDLETTNPELLDKWDYERNKDLLPNMIMKGQHIKVWWKGVCGHSWMATPEHILRGRGCPICAEESKTSFPEQAIYYYIKKSFPDAINGDLEILNGKEMDIFIPSCMTAIEYDGETWHKNLRRDIEKNELCAEKNIRLIRIRENKCPSMESTDLIKIISCASDDLKSLEAAIELLLKMLGKNICADISADRSEIYTLFVSKRKENSLEIKFPDFASEWDYEKNKGLTPNMVSAYSAKKVWWKGKCGHTWQATIHGRTGKFAGCPYCNGRLLKGYNDIGTLYPEVVRMWSEEKNIGVSPSDYTAGSSEKVWWHCDKCKNDFQMSVANKIKHPTACPYCSHRIIEVGVSDFASACKPLLEEWDYEKNAGVNPEKYTKYSDRKVWWICPRGHSYLCSFSNKTNGRGCPICSGRKLVKGINDFETTHPEPLKEWDYEKNLLPPSRFGEHQRIHVWWKDEKGHSWKQTIESRSYGHGCPICGGAVKKRVINLDTNEIFDSLSEAAKSCNLKSGDSIGYCCQGKQKTAGGFHWKYLEE